MASIVVVCKGCCCGNVDRGHDEVPVELLEKAWAERNLEREIQLTISGCLGTCEMRNVVLLRTESDRIWLGGLSEKEQYEAIIDWASSGSDTEGTPNLPAVLEKLAFEGNQQLKLIDILPENFQPITQSPFSPREDVS
jgi:cobaltochelatase CobN